MFVQRNNITNDHYDIKDEVLKEEVKEARLKAKELAKQALQDLLGVTKAAFSGASNELKTYKYVILIALIINIIF